MNSVIYVGMDVHKETIVLAGMRDGNQFAEFERTIRNEPGQVKKFFQRLSERETNVFTCYEAGPTGYTLYRQLEELEIPCLIAAPSLLPRKPGDRVKTDKRDALMLARNLRNGEITPVHVPAEEDEAVRDYLRMCADMKTDLKKCKQRLLQFLLRQGKKYETGRNYWTLAHRRWLKSMEFAHSLQQETFDEYYTAICELEEKIARMEDRIEELGAQQRYAQQVSKLKCFKGINTLSALSFVVEIGDFRRFKKAHELMAYLGLVPSEYSSGVSRRLGGITKAGNSRLRRLLVEASWHYRHQYTPSKRLAARRKGQEIEVIAYADKAGRRLTRKFNKLVYRGKRSQTAVTAVARELSGFLWGMMTGNTSAA